MSRNSYDIWRHAKHESLPLLFGIVQNQAKGATAVPWNPGTNYVTLKPCYSDAATPTGAANVNVYVMHPLNRPASFFGAQVNDVLCYIPLRTKGTLYTPNVTVTGILLSPPIPSTTQQFAHALVNQSSTPGSPNYQAGYPKVHP